MNLHTRSDVGEKHSINVLLREHAQNAKPTSISYILPSTGRVPSREPLCQVSKYDVMLRNLGTCQDYIDKQYVTLSEINKIFRSMRVENCFNDQQTITNKDACNSIYIDPLIRMSKESHSDVPLFGITDAPPIRIHLSIKGNQDIFNLKSLPLMSAPAFTSLIHSGIGRRNPTLNFFDEVMQELLSLMMEADRNLTNVSDLITDINQAASKLRLYPSVTQMLPVTEKVTFFKKCMHRLTSEL